MKLRASLLVLAMSAVGCGDDESSGTGGGGSTGPTVAETCGDYCETVSKVACVSSAPKAECADSCASSFEVAPFCEARATAVVECGAGADPATLTCEEGELVDPPACVDNQTDFLFCACFGEGKDASKVPDPATYCDAYCDKQKDLPCADDAACRANCADLAKGAFGPIASTFTSCIAKSAASAFKCGDEGKPVVDQASVPAECRTGADLLLGCAFFSLGACGSCEAECASSLCDGGSAAPDAACLACVRAALKEEPTGEGGGGN